MLSPGFDELAEALPYDGVVIADREALVGGVTAADVRTVMKRYLSGVNHVDALLLPETPFPMRAGLPEREPEVLRRWEAIGLDEKMRAAAAARSGRSRTPSTYSAASASSSAASLLG